VGLLAADEAGLEEIACLLACQEVAVSRAVVAADDWPTALQALQDEPTVEVIVLVREGEAAAADALLNQVKRSDKPTVVCLLGSDPRLAWRAGAIPAGRLDEAARRAAAWIRGWDQALISSQLQEEDDVLLDRAQRLASSVDLGRRNAAQVLAPASLGHEARLMIAETAGADAVVTCSEPVKGSLAPTGKAAAAGSAAVFLLTLRLGTEPLGGRVQALAQMVEQARAGGALVCVHLYSPRPQALARGEAAMKKAGAIVAESNAAGARLVGLVLRQLAAPHSSK
jgi:hypothetical protein